MLGQWLTDVIRLNPDNFRIFGPDETASNRLQAVFDVTDKQWNAEFIGPEVDEHLARAGRVMEMLSEHQCQGWLEGYLLTGPARAVQLLRGVHPHHRLDVQPARQMAEGHQPHPVAPADREPELPSVQPCLAPGPQRVQPSGSRVHRPRGEQARRGGAGVPAAGRQHPAVHLRPLPALAPVRQRRGRGQAAAARTSSPWTRRSRTARGDSASGNGRAPRNSARTPTSSSRRRATCRRSRASRRSTC